MTNNVQIVEVGPRDGLQNEKQSIPVDTKVELIKRLHASGHSVIEATSFVSPKWVPQLADAADVLAALSLDQETRYPVLVPNSKGLERAIASGVREIAVFTAASEAFNQKNINASIAESLDRIREVTEQAKAQNMRIRGYVSCVLGCPYQGKVDVADVVQVSESLMELGCEEISLGDTIGVGTPKAAADMLKAVSDSIPMPQLAVHFHDTRGQALANILACLDIGVRIVDSSIAGLGGCPYAKGASGNVATEDVAYMLHGMGLSTGLDLQKLVETGNWISTQLGRENASRVGKAGLPHW